MKKIKLFVDGHWFDEAFESTAIFLRGLYNELKHDNRFEILMAAADVDKLRQAFGNDGKIRYLAFKSHSKYYRLAIDAPRLMKDHQIDVSHFQYTTPLIKNTRQIVTIHDLLFMEFPHLFPWSYRTSKNFLFSRSAKKSDLITTVSQFSADAIIRHYKIPPQKVKIIPNGVSKDFFTPYRGDDLPDVRKKYNLGRYLLTVNRVEPRKNHVTLIKAYTNLQLWKNDIRLVMIGRQDLPVKELDEYLNELPSAVKENILWLKNISFPELLSFYKNASLFVYPSLAEGFGIPPLEAAALRTKTLCSGTTAMADFTFFGNDFFDPTSVKELSEKITARLLEEDWQRRDQIARIIQQNYNWETIARDFADQVCALCK